MRVLVVQGPNTGRVLDMSTRQAESALASGWAIIPPTAEVSPAVTPAVVESDTFKGTITIVPAGQVESLEVAALAPVAETAIEPRSKRRGGAR